MKQLLKSAFIWTAVSFSASCFAEMQHSSHSSLSSYAGQEKRAIKSLSEDDISTLKQGGGWGLAKVGELNGYPGPIHVLEMESEIGLTEEQKVNIQKLYEEMRTEAVTLGEKLIKLEKALSDSFSSKEVNQNTLERDLLALSEVRARLRLAHLKAHLKTPHILTQQQITLYNALRGYSANDPCKNIPKGHSVEMWKKHNGCL